MEIAADTGYESPFQWLPPRWLQRLFLGLQSLMGWAGGITTVVVCIVLAHYWSPQFSFVGIVLTPLLWLPTVAIHEFGHVLGARAGGMTVAFVYVGPLQLQALRNGWRVRWQWTRKSRIHGWVMAYPDPSRPMRGPGLLMTIAGPAANLLVAIPASVAVIAWGDSAPGWLAAGLATTNLVAALVNLLPTSRDASSDGLLLLQWLRCRDEQVPELLLARLNGMAIKGVLVEGLPPQQLRAMETMPMPMPLVHLWLMLKEYQHIGAWDQAAALKDVLEDRIAAVPAELGQSVNGLLRPLQCEVRFSRNMAGLLEDDALDQELDADSDWYQPWLRPRCRALMAANTGDEAVTKQYLEEAQQWVARSINRALAHSETLLAQTILERLAEKGEQREAKGYTHHRDAD